MQCFAGIFRLEIPYFAEKHPIAAAITVLSAIVLVIIALDFLTKFIHCTVPVNAEVTNIIPHSSNNKSNVFLFAPEYSYAYNDEQYKRRAKNYSGGKQYEVGAVVKLRIDPRHPESFFDMKRDFTTKRITAAISAVVLIIGIIILK